MSNLNRTLILLTFIVGTAIIATWIDISGHKTLSYVFQGIVTVPIVVWWRIHRNVMTTFLDSPEILEALQKKGIDAKRFETRYRRSERVLRIQIKTRWGWKTVLKHPRWWGRETNGYSIISFIEHGT